MFMSLEEHTFCNANNYIGHMSSSHHFTIMSLEQAKNNYSNLVTIYLTYFPISQIVSGKGSMSWTEPSTTGAIQGEGDKKNT